MDPHLKVERETASFVVSFIRADDHFEVEQVVGIGKVCVAGAWKVELINIWNRKIFDENLSKFSIALKFLPILQ
jgi:hypothetical protein